MFNLFRIIVYVYVIMPLIYMLMGKLILQYKIGNNGITEMLFFAGKLGIILLVIPIDILLFPFYLVKYGVNNAWERCSHDVADNVYNVYMSIYNLILNEE